MFSASCWWDTKGWCSDQLPGRGPTALSHPRILHPNQLPRRWPLFTRLWRVIPQVRRAVGRHHRNTVLTRHSNGVGLGTPHLPTLHKSCHRSMKMRNAHCLWVSLAEDAENANTSSCNVEKGTEAGDRDNKPSQSLGDGSTFYSDAVTSNLPIIARWEPRSSLHSCAMETFKNLCSKKKKKKRKMGPDWHVLHEIIRRIWQVVILVIAK